jgi:hypothetical protein
MRKRNQFCPTGVGRCDFRFAHQAASARKRRSQCRRRWSSAQESDCVSRFLLPAFQHSRQAPVLRPLILLAMVTVVLPHSHWQSHRTRPFAALFSARRITVSLPKRRPVKSWNLGIAEPLRISWLFWKSRIEMELNFARLWSPEACRRRGTRSRSDSTRNRPRIRPQRSAGGQIHIAFPNSENHPRPAICFSRQVFGRPIPPKHERATGFAVHKTSADLMLASVSLGRSHPELNYRRRLSRPYCLAITQSSCRADEVIE